MKTPRGWILKNNKVQKGCAQGQDLKDWEDKMAGSSKRKENKENGIFWLTMMSLNKKNKDKRKGKIGDSQWFNKEGREVFKEKVIKGIQT